MARHAASRNQRRALLRAGLTVAAAGAALGAGGAAAHAAPAVATDGIAGAPLGAATGLVTDSVSGVSELKSLQLHPLANTGMDPLDNAVGTQVADFKPVTTAMVTDNITKGQALEDLPVAGPVTGALLP
ncbi:hypothetical protein [Streptomyces xantholiticus]|uniref:hypothetical protein n=1 Tax=Streptomyces xantholiticus TaxID=68285 RepID=UPI0016722AE2|nr:hypothetical protein [Streptomyces xantholiticus]GGW70685.1 hypothetical protein GCM10010381_64320 [Streptomyces xantholiticus]